MKTEHELNSYLAKKFRELSPRVKYMKASDKFGVGVSDFLLWYHNGSLALESKLIQEWPSPKAMLLKHPFTGPQITFLKTHALAGQRGYGLVAVKKPKVMLLIDHDRIPLCGNWSTWDFCNHHVSYTHAISWGDPANDIMRLLGCR